MALSNIFRSVEFVRKTKGLAASGTTLIVSAKVIPSGFPFKKISITIRIAKK